MPQFIFDSLDEVRAFIAELDGEDTGTAQAGTTPRRGRRKAADANTAAAQPGNSGFGPPLGGTAATPATGFGAPAQPGQIGFGAPPPGQAQQPQPSPLVQAIIAKTEQAIAAGQPMEAVVGWYRTALGPETAQADWNQIKAAFLPKANEPLLKQIAAQLGVQ